MQIQIRMPSERDTERRVQVDMESGEVAAVHLNIAHPEKRNRTGHYLRRHGVAGRSTNGATQPVDPNKPERTEAPPKWSIRQHVRAMREAGVLPGAESRVWRDGCSYESEASMIAVPVSDVTANLLRPCYHSRALGERRIFRFDAEPREKRTYYAACYFGERDDGPCLGMRQVRFDEIRDTVCSPEGDDLGRAGLTWATALVPLVIDGRPLEAAEIARADYDLRHSLGRKCTDIMQYVYNGWYDAWDRRVEDAIRDHERSGRAFAVFYHSILGQDASGGIHVFQREGTLNGLARSLASEGICQAGILDSGGSCAVYDVWLDSYLSHGWYFREPRGAILVFELRSYERIPTARAEYWIRRRDEVSR